MGVKDDLMNLINNDMQAEVNTGNNDYVNEKDGLIYCGICNSPKEKIVELFGETKKVYVACTCRQKEIDEERKEHEEYQRRIRLNMLRDATFDDSVLHNQTFEKADNTLEHKNFAMRYVEHFDEMEKENIGLLFSGDIGTGKTFLAASIANALVEKGVTVKMTNFSRILNDMTNLQIDKNKYIKSQNEKRLLIIDDFGIQRDTSFATEHIFNIIDSRYRTNKPVIFTTNYSVQYLMNAENLKEKRIYSRVLEMATPMMFTGENFRLKIMKEKAKKANVLLNL